MKPQTLFLAEGIQWETDGEENLGLPVSCVVPLSSELADTEDLQDHICGALSDKYGYLVNSIQSVTKS